MLFNIATHVGKVCNCGNGVGNTRDFDLTGISSRFLLSDIQSQLTRYCKHDSFDVSRKTTQAAAVSFWTCEHFQHNVSPISFLSGIPELRVFVSEYMKQETFKIYQ